MFLNLKHFKYMELLFRLISIVLLMSFVVSLLFTIVGLVGTILDWIKRRSNKNVQPSRNWPKVFIRSLLVLIAVIVLSIASFFAYAFLPCEWGGPCIIIEDKGKIKVSERPEVKALVQKYGKNHVHIEALEIELVKHTAFIEKIYPNLAEDTGCIIIAHAGDEGYVYREDKKLNIAYQETLAEFMERTKNINSEFMSKFYLSLH